VWRGGAGTKQGRLSDEGDQAGKNVEGKGLQILKVNRHHRHPSSAPTAIFEGVDIASSV